MANNTLQLRKNVNHTYKVAEFNGFAFTSAEKRYNKFINSRYYTLEIINNKVSAFWIVGCVLAILGSICIGYFQAYTAKTSIGGFLDPLAEGSVPNHVLLAIGLGISIFGLIMGHLIHESIEINKHTDETKYKPSFWLFILFGAFYIGFQFVLAKIAGESVANGQTDYMPYVVAGLGLLEIIIGAVVLEKAMAYISLFLINVILGFILRKMGRKSRKTNNTYRDYLTLVNAHNASDNTNPITREGNDNIRRAIAYYSNIKLEEKVMIEETKPVENIIPIEETTKTIAKEQSNNVPIVPTKVVAPFEAEQHLAKFMNDTTDDDLTA